MFDPSAEINAVLEAEAPALFASLSPLGRRAFFPPDIPAQAAQARGKRWNGTIGQITDGHGGAVGIPALAGALAGLGERERSQALLYSPIEGIHEVRERWRAWQRRGVAAEIPSSLPIVTVGLTHALSILAELFIAEGRPVAVAAPLWGNYRQTFAVRGGGRMVTAPAYVDGRFSPLAFEQALADVPVGEPAVALVNIPSNPGGYSPDPAERLALVSSLLRIAADRTLVVVCDDAYLGLVYEPGIACGSLFWELVGAHPNLVPVKVDGATKEFSFFGGRVGFLTFAVDPASGAAKALESKVKMLIRSGLGSPVATSQMVLLGGLRQAGVEEDVEAVRQLLEGRYRALKAALAEADPELIVSLPFNSGCFALVELPEKLGLTSEQVRLHLLEKYETGLISIAPRYLRIAHCSVDEADLPEMVERMVRAVTDLAG